MARLASLVIVGSALAVSSSASAEVFKLYGEVHGGGMYGAGIAGDQKDQSFFQKSRGGAYGAQVGAQFLIFDGHVHHHQYVNGDGLKTWTQLTLGLNFGFDTGSEQDKKEHKGGYVAMGVGAGFGVGTGAQVDPPLDNSEITDKGFILEGRFGFGKHLSKVFDIGVTVPVSYGYLFKSGNGATANDVSTQYQTVQLDVLLVLRANLRFI